MAKLIAEQIIKEIKQVEREMTAQKKVIKNSVGNARIIELAETELKALHTRHIVLEGNLKKLQTDESA
jgi:hypothetical protein